jgi:hypothetical protein
LVGQGVFDARHAPIERGLDVPQPTFERRRLGLLPRAQKLNALPYLPQHKRAETQIVIATDAY